MNRSVHRQIRSDRPQNRDTRNAGDTREAAGERKRPGNRERKPRTTRIATAGNRGVTAGDGAHGAAVKVAADGQVVDGQSAHDGSLSVQ